MVERQKWYKHCKVDISGAALDSGIIKLKLGKGKKVVQVITKLTDKNRKVKERRKKERREKRVIQIISSIVAF